MAQELGPLKLPDFRTAPFGATLMVAGCAFAAALLAVPVLDGKVLTAGRWIGLLILSLPSLALTALWLYAVHGRLKLSAIYLIAFVAAPAALAWPLALVKLAYRTIAAAVK